MEEDGSTFTSRPFIPRMRPLCRILTSSSRVLLTKLTSRKKKTNNSALHSALKKCHATFAGQLGAVSRQVNSSL
jgi:hypothetical protein